MSMRILQVASEAVPFAKTGGLADVVGALSRHLAGVGHHVDLILPRYRSLRRTSPAEGGETIEWSAAELGSQRPATLVRGPDLHEARVWFVDQPELFDRSGLYGEDGADYPDNLERFALLCRVAVAAALHPEFAPDLVHCHDWHTGLVPAWLEGAVPTVLTVHNLAYQGVFGGLNLLRVGLETAGQVTTVSPTYAAEVQRVEGGFGLDHVLRALDPPIRGILNGLDVDTWNPASDACLPEPYDADALEGKRAARRALLEEFTLDVPEEAPVFGLVSRLVGQKGIGLFDGLRERIAALAPAGFVFVGTGDPAYERLIRGLDALPNVAVRIAFSERLAHLVEGGADFFLMPSAFEPCGLNQMISQRYGTIPIVHRTGGLADTVTPVNEQTLADGTASGIVFEVFDTAGLAWGIDEALRLFGEAESFDRLRRSIMRIDHSWDRRIEDYLAIYRSLTKRPAPSAASPSPKR